jgi:hypothetical protein
MAAPREPGAAGRIAASADAEAGPRPRNPIRGLLRVHTDRPPRHDHRTAEHCPDGVATSVALHFFSELLVTFTPLLCQRFPVRKLRGGTLAGRGDD